MIKCVFSMKINILFDYMKNIFFHYITRAYFSNNYLISKLLNASKFWLKNFIDNASYMCFILYKFTQPKLCIFRNKICLDSQKMMPLESFLVVSLTLALLIILVGFLLYMFNSYQMVKWGIKYDIISIARNFMLLCWFLIDLK